jgi:hypothetical protein
VLLICDLYVKQESLRHCYCDVAAFPVTSGCETTI